MPVWRIPHYLPGHDLGLILPGMGGAGWIGFVVVFIADILVFGFLCAAIAKQRGQSQGGWFIVGALLGIFGLLLALFMPCSAPYMPPPQPPGWYTDPWQQSSYRWWDGYQWTWQTG